LPLTGALPGNTVLLRLLRHKKHYAIKNAISLSILNSQFSILDKASFVNPQITAIFAATGGFGGKKRLF
jgi:hypothetical protein